MRKSDIKKRKLSLFLIFAFIAFGITSHVFPFASLRQTISVKNTLQKFYKALNDIFDGNITPMERVWSHTKDVTYLSPDGSFNVGWKEVLADWTLQAKQHLSGEVTPTNMHMVISQNIAIAQSYVKGHNVDQTGRTQSISLRATVVLRQENGQWKVISVHTDKLRFLKE
jgi:ketosteroid isomerase-like protein